MAAKATRYLSGGSAGGPLHFALSKEMMSPFPFVVVRALLCGLLQRRT